MVDSGIGVDFICIYTIPLNPLLGGVRYSWEPKAGLKVREFTHEMMASGQFIGGPVHHTQRSGKPLRYRVGAMPDFDVHRGSGSSGPGFANSSSFRFR